MNFRKTVFFILVLLMAQVAAGALTVFVIGPENTDTLILVSFVSSFVVAACIFSWMSWTVPGKPYVAAFGIGIAVGILDAIATWLVVGVVFWNPVVFLVDLSALSVAVFVGVNIGECVRRRTKHRSGPEFSNTS